jgi:putative addiction module component (TIGR02574 family)
MEATALPVEERALIVDSLLRSLNMPDRHVENEWISIAHRRLEELRSGRVRAVPGDEVFANIHKRFAQ